MDETPPVSVDGLRQRYGDFEAVAGISFEVAPGEMFALLGTNGEGKTTTLETLEGHRPAQGGTVRVLGRDPYRERRAVRPRIGFQVPERLRVAELPALRGARADIAVDGGRAVASYTVTEAGAACTSCCAGQTSTASS
ncbi:ATP-binding cassette domain-containing protein [Actinomadura nitritigenes]|uniref:ATP-binding cassette domain-containing protein n=1 Tax=Actinomadura nitritigenes TaxID=134602 RepID=UPI003D92E9F0